MSDAEVIGLGIPDGELTEQEVRNLFEQVVRTHDFRTLRILILIPDGTRTGPIPLLFRLFHEYIRPVAQAMDYLIALGTHQPMTEEAINRLVGVTDEERKGLFADVRIYNHRWDLPGTFHTAGIISADETAQLSQNRLAQEITVRVNRLVYDYDLVMICGPVFPHEVAGFSGGNKYFFPGISGSEVINFTHWLGALITSYDIIGTKYTPVRAVIDRAAAMIDRPKICFCMVVRGHHLSGLYVGAPEQAWSEAADLSAQVHVRYVDRPYRKILSVMPEMYDDIWTGAKGMYKLEPVAAEGGEVIIYAPHITEISYTHGKILDEIGYHVRDYFTAQWERFKAYPWGVLAHSTHLKGSGTFENGIEKPRVTVTLATGIPRERCERVNLGYADPASINVRLFENREDEGILVVPHAGEILYRLKP